MATFREALTRRLLDDAGVAAIAANRITWGVRPQGEALPGIRLTVVAQARPQHLKGLQRGRPTRVQADCFGRTPAEAEALAEAVLAVAAQPGRFSGVAMALAEAFGPIDMTEHTPDGILHRQTVDVTIWHDG